MVWGFPLFARVVAWLHSGSKSGLVSSLPLSLPLVVWQSMTKGCFFFFYILIDHYFKLLMISLSNQLIKKL
jgi:hypothetical protein